MVPKPPKLSTLDGRPSKDDRSTPIHSTPQPPKIAIRIDEVAARLSVSTRTIERERSAGRFPGPDLKIGKVPLWRPETIQRWVDEGGAR